MIFSQICIANNDFQHFQSKWNDKYEIGTCAKSYYFIQNDNLTVFKIKKTSGIYKGTETNIEFRCFLRYDTMIHSHPNNYCEPSKIDLNFLKKSKWATVSIIVCEKESLILIKQGNEIKKVYK